MTSVLNGTFVTLDPKLYMGPGGLFERAPSPALVVYLDAVRHNLARMLELMGGPMRWRPHLKTTKLKSVWSLLLEAGVRHFKCATVREAEVLLELSRQSHLHVDLLVAYPHQGPNLFALQRLAKIHPGSRLALLCEDLEFAHKLPKELGVFVDLNPGMDRTGVPLAETQRIAAIAKLLGVRFRGLHCYDGQHSAAGPERQAAIWAGYGGLRQVCAALQRSQLGVPEIISAGTPAFQAALAYPEWSKLCAVHRVSPGTVVFHDLRSEEETPELGLRPAALLLTRVVSRPRTGRITCDAGSKSLSTDGGDPAASVLGEPAWVVGRASEEHLPIEVGGSAVPELGRCLLLIPRHVCTTVNLAEQALVIDGTAAPSVEAVAARAHGLWIEA